MNNYTPDCEKNPDEDYSFEATCTWKDGEDLIFDVQWNEKCETCFLQEECVTKILKIISKEYEIPNEDFEIIHKTAVN